jgi:hypothetical protein
MNTKIHLFHDTSRPRAGDEIFLGDYCSRLFHQRCKDVEGPVAQWDFAPIFDQNTLREH